MEDGESEAMSDQPLHIIICMCMAYVTIRTYGVHMHILVPGVKY